jgi:hypothetical protein
MNTCTACHDAHTLEIQVIPARAAIKRHQHRSLVTIRTSTYRDFDGDGDRTRAWPEKSVGWKIC